MQNHWLDTTEYPFTSCFFDVNGQKMHFIDEGKGHTLLFVHGTPSWSFDYRHLIKSLSSQYRCIAIDHIGFGLSDKPKNYDYSTPTHSETLEKFVLEKDLRDFTLVMHDFGGAIATAMALRQIQRVKHLVYLNSWLWNSEEEADFQKLRKILENPLLPFLYKYLNFSPRFILPKSFVKKPSAKILRHYTKPFANSHQRNGTLAFAKSLLKDQHWFELLWQQKQILQAKPTLFVWGMKDPIISPSNLGKFMQGFPSAQVLQLFESGHFPQEEEPEKIILHLSEFLEKNL